MGITGLPWWGLAFINLTWFLTLESRKFVLFPTVPKIQNFDVGWGYMNLNYKTVCVNAAELLKYNWNLLT
jgi:hypothetical protein